MLVGKIGKPVVRSELVSRSNDSAKFYLCVLLVMILSYFVPGSDCSDDLSSHGLLRSWSSSQVKTGGDGT